MAEPEDAEMCYSQGETTADEAKIKRLTKQLKEHEENLQLAGNFGKQLLDTNTELNNRIESVTQEYSAQIEQLEQEKYAIQMRLDQKVHMEKNFEDELESVKAMLNKQQSMHQEFLDTEYADEINGMKGKIQQLQADADRAQDNFQQKVEKYQQLEEINSQLKEQVGQQLERMNETCSDEMASVTAELKCLYAEKNALELDLSELRKFSEQREMKLASLAGLLETKDAEIEQVECKSTSYYNALEKSRDEVKELKAELDHVLMETQDNKKKGNSLFAEVEDRRVVAEKTLISCKVQLSAVQKQYEASRQQLHQLKVQLASMLHMSGGRADEKHIHSLQQQLSQANSERMALLESVRKYESMEKTAAEYESQMRQNGEDDNFVQYLKALVKTKDKEISEMQGQQHSQQFRFLAKSEELRNSEQRYYSVQKQVEMLQAENMKLRLKLEELSIKYEPDKYKPKRSNIRIFREKIPLGNNSPEEQKDEDSRTAQMEKTLVEGSGKENHVNPKKAAAETKGGTKPRDPKLIKAMMMACPKAKPTVQSSHVKEMKRKVSIVDPKSE